MDAKFLRTIDAGAGKWCENTCNTVYALRADGRRLVLSEFRAKVGPTEMSLHLDLQTLTIVHNERDKAGTHRWTEACILKPFSGFASRPPPF